mmetsp:Transcript_39194/g.44103  ORF Transcript_39194/g.44103 Transcript_39194/m.44103 type:complete len:82 (-) Transcript_39194:1015-1260(-)
MMLLMIKGISIDSIVITHDDSTIILTIPTTPCCCHCRPPKHQSSVVCGDRENVIVYHDFVVVPSDKDDFVVLVLFSSHPLE